MIAGFDSRIGLAMLYAASAGVCVLADTQSSLAPRGLARPTPVWRWGAVLLLAMAVNALLHIDMAFVSWARELAVHSDWYAFRRPIQVAVLLVLLAGIVLQVCGSGPAVWGWKTRIVVARSGMLASGLGLLLVLTALRLVSLHHTDLLLDWPVAGLRLGRLAELAGLGLVLLASVLKTARGS